MIRSWQPGDRLTHRHNPGLGPGRVVGVSQGRLDVEFPECETRLLLVADSPALAPVVFRPGQRVRHLTSGQTALVAELLADGRVRLGDGSSVAGDLLWPLELDGSLIERLAASTYDPGTWGADVEDFELRLDALHLAAVREASGLGSFLGGRVRLFPHQLHVALRATATDPVRWLLADEVGLGKTVEACLILDHLVRTRGIERCLIVAPPTLTVQWLGELWRKYHQVFVLLDEARLADVARDFGPRFNPFDVHRRVVVSLELLKAQPRLTAQAAQAGIDLLVVDEAHHLRRPRGHQGDPGYRAIEPIARLGRHVLLLTATPLEDDAHGFFRLLQMLRPDDFPLEEAFDEQLLLGRTLPACTSSTRRVDIGGLPARRGVPVAIDDAGGWQALADLEAALHAEPAAGPLARRRKADRLRRATSSGAALAATLSADDAERRRLAVAADAVDPRIAWLAAQARAWKQAGERTLVFVAYRETLELLRTQLSQRAQIATAAFHEDLQVARRDIEVAQFRLPGGPSLLISTECGGEGRNFEFCDRLVLFDLPWNPVAVEQRIGRLDRIGRTREVPIFYFQPPGGIAAAVARTYGRVGIFREPLAGLETELLSLEAALESAALAGREFASEAVEPAVTAARAAHARIRDAAYHQLHVDPYRPELAAAILARVPKQLDELNEDVVVAACERLGFALEHHANGSWSIELGLEALVDQLPGVPGGSSFLGSFERDRAVADDTLEFFAAGHPLVEGLLAHLDESPLGRTCVLRLAFGAARGLGLLALYREGQGFAAVALDGEGRVRPEWAAALLRRPLRTRRLGPDDVPQPEFGDQVRRLGDALDPLRRPVAVAALVVGP